MLKALIFDVDGTLADTEADGHRVAYNRAFREAGLEWYWSRRDYGRLLAISGGKERLRCHLDTRRRDPESGLPGDPDPLIEDLYQKKTRHFIALAERGRLLPRPGILRIMVEAKKAGLILAIATSTDEKNVRALLRSSFNENLESWFEYIAAGETVDKKKPAPDVYNQVLKTLRLDARECLAVEDSANGLRAASAAGIPTVVTWNPYTRNDDFSAACLVIEDLDKPCRFTASGYPGSIDASQKPLDLHALIRIHADWVSGSAGHSIQAEHVPCPSNIRS